jgi:hypothetical protein
MKYFPDESAGGIWARYAVAALPLVYLIVALVYSAYSAPWGRQVDPESTYAMNGLAWAAGYPMMKSDHPGTTTILLTGLVIKLWTYLGGRPDVVVFGLKNFDAIIYVSRAAEALILSGTLLASGVIVRNATGSALAAMLFQVAPFVHPVALHFDVVLASESLMISSAIFGMALVLKAALDERPPTVWLGAAQGLAFGLGLSSKILQLPLAILGVSLLRNRWAFGIAFLTGILSFFLFNRIFNPNVFSGGFHWLVRLATHKGFYGAGEAGFIDFNLFWRNMGEIISASPVISAVFTAGALVALTRMLTRRDYLDPISLTLVASFFAFAALLVATSKHFDLHYMVASWVLAGGVLVLTVVEIRRLFPAVPPRAIAGAAAAVCAILISTSLFQVGNDALNWAALDEDGAKLSRAVMVAGPSCANVSGMYMQAPEDELNFGGDSTLGTPEMQDRFAEAYARVFKAPLLDYNFYRDLLSRNFHPYSFRQLAAEYPCIVVRTAAELSPTTSNWLVELRPDHCVVDGIQVYAVGIACEKIRRAAQNP